MFPWAMVGRAVFGILLAILAYFSADLFTKVQANEIQIAVLQTQYGEIIKRLDHISLEQDTAQQHQLVMHEQLVELRTLIELRAPPNKSPSIPGFNRRDTLGR